MGIFIGLCFIVIVSFAAVYKRYSEELIKLESEEKVFNDIPPEPIKPTTKPKEEPIKKPENSGLGGCLDDLLK